MLYWISSHITIIDPWQVDPAANGMLNRASHSRVDIKEYPGIISNVIFELDPNHACDFDSVHELAGFFHQVLVIFGNSENRHPEMNGVLAKVALDKDRTAGPVSVMVSHVCTNLVIPTHDDLLYENAEPVLQQLVELF
jgi:hypothetical protein